MRTFVAVAAGLLGACSSARMEHPLDADGAAAVDARAVDGASADAPAADARPDAPSVDAAIDGPPLPIDAALDAPPCTISTGQSITLDGTGDLAAYPAAQRLTPGATLAATDEVALTWDPTYLYVTVTSEAFLDAARPLHVYLETATALGAAAATAGKEYGGNTARLGFAPTHLVAVRRTSDLGTGAYDGVYSPGGAMPWTTRSVGLTPGTDVFVSSDNRTLSVRTPWTALGGCPLAARVAVHVVNGVVGNEWKDLVPTTHTPWLVPGGGYYELALTAAPAISGWTLR